MSLKPRLQGLTILSLLTIGLLLTLVVNTHAQEGEPTEEPNVIELQECDWGAKLIVHFPAPDDPNAAVSSSSNPASPTATPTPTLVPPDDVDLLVIELEWNDPVFDTANPCEAIRAFYERENLPDVIVEEVTAISLLSYPPQLSLQISGFYSDGCEFPLRVVRSHKDQEITIKLYRVIDPATSCLAALTPFERSIGIGFLEAGEYEVKVNDFVLPLDWQY